jgi:cyclic pyranopterin phosphate synthase
MYNFIRNTRKMTKSSLSSISSSSSAIIHSSTTNFTRRRLHLQQSQVFQQLDYHQHQQRKTIQLGYFSQHPFHTSTRCNSSNSDGDNNGKTGAEHHNLYQQQMMELEEERTQLFGDGDHINDNNQSTTNTNTTITAGSNSSSSDDNDMQMTLDDMNAAREELYNFSSAEKQAWNNFGANSSRSSSNSNDGNNANTHSPNFMKAIQQAREAKAAYEAELEQKKEEHLQTMLLQEHHTEGSNLVGSDSGNLQEEESQGQSQVFTHLNKSGDDISMVDVGDKKISKRIAVARSSVVFPPEVMDALGIYESNSSSEGSSSRTEVVGPKGPIFATARLAGIMGAKRTSDLIPLCHPLPLSKVNVDINMEGNVVMIECECRVTHKTGVEMEALAGATIAALTIYDMVKAVSHRVTIESTTLVSKTGGKRDIQ